MRTWAEVDLDAIECNIRNIRKITDKKAKVMAIVKADAYGHGCIETATVLAKNGADCFGVATFEEAVRLRENGFLQDILVLSTVPVEDIESAVVKNITLTVFTLSYAELVSKAAQKNGIDAKVHIKLDTGMGRIGYVVSDSDNSDIVSEIISVSKLSNVFVEGIFSHFSTSDEKDGEYTHLQFKRFMRICEALREKGLDIPIKHIANSGAIIMYPEYHLDMVRAGIILYGLYPSDEVDKEKLALVPAMTLKSKITYIKDLEENRGISYGKEYITDSVRKIATVPVGYGDGYVRSYAKDGEMIVNGEKVKIVGRICMDQCMIDITNVHNINIGDEVIIFSDKQITADSLAKISGTINYEVVCMISKRVPRIYKRGR